MKKVRVMLFAGAAELADSRQIELEVPSSACVAELRALLVEKYPQLSKILAISRWAADKEFVDENFLLQATDCLALIPPVSGG